MDNPKPKVFSFFRKWKLPRRWPPWFRLRLWVWISETVRPSELQATLFWAGVVGLMGGLTSVAFREATLCVQYMLTLSGGDVVKAFHGLAWRRRLLIPMLGGVLAGLAILGGKRYNRREKTTDYMEAVVLGSGVVSIRLSLIKCLSALFSIASGGSIGREGPMAQLAVLAASVVGRLKRWPAPRLRLIVACGAAAGIASAYNAPIAGALFVSEIVLGSVAMESFGPLVFASVVATLVTRRLVVSGPLYAIPQFQLNSSWEIPPYLLLGALAGLAAPWFLRALRFSEAAFNRLPVPLVVRFALGGLAVGALAIKYPEVCGNGQTAVSDILNGKWVWEALALIMVSKILATCATFGSGAVGGVFTPTLFVGASLGYLFGQALQGLWPVPAPSAFALVGMGAFLAAATHAPVMAIIILFELTLDYQIILPLMLSCVVAYYTSIRIEKASIYSESLRRKGAFLFDQRLYGLSVSDLIKKNPVSVRADSRFAEIARQFISNRINNLYVTDEAGAFLGVVALHEIKRYLQTPEIADLVIASDILQRDFPAITPEDSLSEALERFSRVAAERLPVVEKGPSPRLIGSISKSDLILALSERAKMAPRQVL